MPQLKNISLFIKLLTPIVILFMLIGAILFVGNLNNDRLIAVQKNMASSGIARISEISALLQKFQTLDGQFYRYLIGQSTNNLENGEEKMAALKLEAIELDKNLEKLLQYVEGDEKKALLQLKENFQKNVIGLNDDGVYDVAIQMMGIDVGFVLKGIDGYSMVYTEFLIALKKLKTDIKENANTMVVQSEQEIRGFQFMSLLISGTIGALAILGSIALILVVVKSIKTISETTALLAEGNNDVDIKSLERKDELGQIVGSLNKFKENQLEVKRLTEEQEQLKHEQEFQRKRDMQELASQFDSQVGTLITSLTSSSGQMQSTAETMRSIADETSQASQAVVSSSDAANSNVSTVASAMEEMSASSSEIAQQITSARSKSNDTAVNANKASQTVSDLSNLVDNIGEVVVAIQDIAEQTNLLALNATIEAARAGDAGKGFAVVADEVKKLATETGQKTEEIGSQISNIQSATKASVDAMQKIIENISEIDQSVTGVSAAVEEQNITNKEIVRSISEASQGVSQVAQIIVDVQKGAGETGTSADSVLCAAQEVAGFSQNLKISVEQFLDQIRNDAATQPLPTEGR